MFNPTYRYYSQGEMTDHCLALLSYVSQHREEEQSVNYLAEKCGIPEPSLRMILNEFISCKVESLLFGVAMCYGYDFMVYANYYEEPALNHYDRKNNKKKVIDVVKCDWKKYKYTFHDYMFEEDREEENP